MSVEACILVVLIGVFGTLMYKARTHQDYRITQYNQLLLQCLDDGRKEYYCRNILKDMGTASSP